MPSIKTAHICENSIKHFRTLLWLPLASFSSLLIFSCFWRNLHSPPPCTFWSNTVLTLSKQWAQVSNPMFSGLYLLGKLTCHFCDLENTLGEALVP